MCAANLDTLAAALAFRRVNKDAEERAAFALRVRDVEVLAGLRPVRALLRNRLGVAESRKLFVEDGFRQRFPEDRGVRADVHAVHATDAPGRVEDRDLWRQVAEVAERAGPGRNQAAAQAVVGGESVRGPARRIGWKDPVAEVLEIDEQVDLTGLDERHQIPPPAAAPA